MVLQSTHLWIKLINEVLTTQKGLTSASEDDLNWIRDQFISKMSNLSGDNIYRFIVLANRKSGCGQFALTFNNKLTKIASSRSESDFEAFITSDLGIIMPEVVLNSHLSNEQKEMVFSNLKTEMLALNMTMDTLLSSSKVHSSKESILGSRQHLQCFGNVCTYESKLTMSVNQMPSVVSVVTRDNNSPVSIIYMFPLVQLITLMAVSGNNPYTGSKFSDVTIKTITNRYKIESSMVKHYLGVQ